MYKELLNMLFNFDIPSPSEEKNPPKNQKQQQTNKENKQLYLMGHSKHDDDNDYY